MKKTADYVNHYLTEYNKLKHKNSVPDWLKTIRENGINAFTERGLPTKRDEEWRFIDLNPIYKNNFKLASTSPDATPVSKDQISAYNLGNLDCHLLVVIDGILNTDLSLINDSKDTILINNICEMASNGNCSNKNDLFKYTDIHNNAFAALNTAFFENGVYITVPDKTILTKPIHIMYLTTDRGFNAVTFPYSHIDIGVNSKAEIIESYAGIANNCYFTNQVTEIRCGENSTVTHYKLQRESTNAYHIGMLSAFQQKNTCFTSCTLSFGSKINRNTVNVYLSDENSECILNGLYFGKEQQTIDNHTRIDHAKPNCRSWEVFNGILDDNASGVFNGKIHVHPDAQKTDAKQTNRCLLLSDNAKINTKPELEIYADDVKCTHGATIGQLNEEAIFYLRSRGIDYPTAHLILTKAFAGEVIDTIKISELKDEIETILNTYFC